jgi:hypothetical protein
VRGVLVFLLWVALFVAEVVTSGALSIVLFALMILMAGYGGHLFAGWSRRVGR